MGHQIHPQITDFENLLDAARAPMQHGSYTREKVEKRERLSELACRAAFLIALAHRQKQHRHLSRGPSKRRQSWRSNSAVADEEVIVGLAGQIHRVTRMPGDIHGESIFHQTLSQIGGGIVLWLDQQYPHRSISPFER